MHHNHPGNKRINDHHYYPDTDRTTGQHAGGDPRGLTTTGRQAADKVRDLRLRKTLTGKTTKPKRPEAEPVKKPQGWVPPDWILKALAESGDTHLLDEEPTTKARDTRSTDSSWTASSSADPPPKRAKTSERRGSETLSLSRAVEAY